MTAQSEYPPLAVPALNEDAEEEVIAVIKNHLPDYLARDERQRLAEQMMFALAEEGIYIAPTWLLGVPDA